ncbi:MAG: J domain-containing protein [Dehalococcoidia bacterium]|nr:MAG: J domain-containing protein [Dehalococcoidia bacterium]
MTTARGDRKAAHWKRLGLIPGAPECVIKAAHRALIERHHPDRGGDAELAKAVNVAFDEVKGSGTLANEYVAANFHAEPWVVLGITAAAEAELAQRAGKQLAAELRTYPRLAERVAWAMANFATAQRGERRERITPLTAPPPRRTTPSRSRRGGPEPAAPGVPDGLPMKIDFGRVQWHADATRTVQLTWKRFAPYAITVEAAGPVRAEVTASKVLPGRFSIAFSIDWNSPEFAPGPTVRGYTLDAPVRIRWSSDGEITIPARGLIHYPALVSASPQNLDLGTVDLRQNARASLVLVSSSTTEATIEPPAWLRRSDGSGRPVDAPLRLATNVPVRVEFRVDWAPIVERASASFEARRPVRPTGRIVVRWDGNEIEVPAQMVVPPPTPSRR